MGNRWSRRKSTFVSYICIDALPATNTCNDSSSNLSSDRDNVHQITRREVFANSLPHSVVAVGMHNYNASDVGDLGFQKGDRLIILNDSGDWWYVRHAATDRAGYVPRNFVAREMTVESKDWFFGNMTRNEAENILMQQQYARGTFVIRNCEKKPNAFSLSVKDFDLWKGSGYYVKHYAFLVTVGHSLSTLQRLVKFYSGAANGLCCKLKNPCEKPKPHLLDLSPETSDHWEIDPKELTLLKKVGNGNFGEVYYGKWRGTTEVAIKMLKAEAIMSTEAFLKEATTMKALRHEKLVSLYAVCSVREPIYIVTEFMLNGSLLDYLRDGNGINLNFNQLINIAAQVASGMKYLEEKRLVHRDLAARNVLVGENNEVKIADFGLARIIKDSEYLAKTAGFPVKWSALEAVLLGKFTVKSDVWSFGIFLMELVTHGHTPYPGMHNYEVIEELKNGYRMPYPTNCKCHRDIYDLMLQCWDSKPEKRPTFRQLFTYLDDFNIVSVEPKYWPLHHPSQLSLTRKQVKDVHEPWSMTI